MPRLRLVPIAAALVVVGALGLGGCASDADIEPAQFASDLVKRTAITDDEADCLTDKVYAKFDQAEVNRIYHAATEAEVGGDTLEVLDEFNADCITADGQTTDEDADSGSDDGDASTTTEADDAAEDDTTTTEG